MDDRMERQEESESLMTTLSHRFELTLKSILLLNYSFHEPITFLIV